MREPFFLQTRGRSKASENVRARREARFERMREEQAKQRRDVDSTDWHAQTIRRLRDQRSH